MPISHIATAIASRIKHKGKGFVLIVRTYCAFHSLITGLALAPPVDLLHYDPEKFSFH